MSRPGDRVVPTLTEVLDEQYWQAVDPLEVQAVSQAPERDLPLLAEPLIDLSDDAVLGAAAAPEEVLPATVGALVDPAEPPFRLKDVEATPSNDLLDAELDPVLRRALSNALMEAIPDMVDLLLPLMRRQLAADLVRLNPERAATVASQP